MYLYPYIIYIYISIYHIYIIHPSAIKHGWLGKPSSNDGWVIFQFQPCVISGRTKKSKQNSSKWTYGGHRFLTSFNTIVTTRWCAMFVFFKGPWDKGIKQMTNMDSVIPISIEWAIRWDMFPLYPNIEWGIRWNRKLEATGIFNQFNHGIWSSWLWDRGFSCWHMLAIMILMGLNQTSFSSQAPDISLIWNTSKARFSAVLTDDFWDAQRPHHARYHLPSVCQRIQLVNFETVWFRFMEILWDISSKGDQIQWWLEWLLFSWKTWDSSSRVFSFLRPSLLLWNTAKCCH